MQSKFSALDETTQYEETHALANKCVEMTGNPFQNVKSMKQSIHYPALESSTGIYIQAQNSN